jgi:hypothetical protein
MMQLFRVVVLTGADDREEAEVFVETGDGLSAAVSIAERYVRQENMTGYETEVVSVQRACDGPVVRLEDVASGH